MARCLFAVMGRGELNPACGRDVKGGFSIFFVIACEEDLASLTLAHTFFCDFSTGKQNHEDLLTVPNWNARLCFSFPEFQRIENLVFIIWHTQDVLHQIFEPFSSHVQFTIEE
jgi:hypothetical protein